MTPMPMTDGTLETLKLSAEYKMSQYPQYKGHFAGYKLCVVQKQVKTKLGLAFYDGEIAMYDPATENDGLHPGFVVVWSMSNRCDTSVKLSNIFKLEA